MKTAQEIRNAFLDFFKSKEHLIVPSAPVVLKDDPTLMFTNAGMNQFKDAFLGNKQAQAPRIADTQKCLRVSGKHNDLGEVGHDTYHLTLFEMLGNWSFGDYYKKESIDWAWELLTEVYKIPKDRLYVTVFGGDDAMGLPEDTEAYDYWKQWIAEERILKASAKDNFWEMGDTGPCGPCSEIHVDLRSDADRAAVPGASRVNQDDPRVVEIWNLVFMEFNRLEDKSLVSLPAKNVDTGMGFERLCMVLQNVDSVYDTAVFASTKAYLEKLFQVQYGQDELKDIAFRVIMDHIRAITFTIADGQIPASGGAGYVVRRILRRASRYAYQFLGRNEPFLYQLVPVLAEEFKSIFPEVHAQQNFIARILEEEEKSFIRKLEKGTEMFEEYLASHAGGDKTVDGAFSFKLFDTFGFPYDLTELMATEKGWKMDKAGYDAHMEAQKKRSQDAGKVEMGDWVEVHSMDAMPVFRGYETLELEAKLVRYRTVRGQKGNQYQVVLDEVPFYAESGGQVGDTGKLVSANETLQVLDTRKENDLIVLQVDKLPESPGGSWTATVDGDRRRLIRANHSATHLMHAALREVLGTHVEQRGSLVSDSVLRFDFSHFAKMTEEEIARVEAIVNAKIAAGISLDERRDVPIAQAKAMGAMALFGEKYGDAVRVIVFDPKYSVELCGGTHVANTAEIRYFKIVSEASSAAGIRRIEAYTSDRALAYLNNQVDSLNRIADLLKNPKDVVKAVEELANRNRDLEKEVERFNQEKVNGLQNDLRGKVKNRDGLNLLNEVVEIPSAKDLQALAFNLRNVLDNTVVVLGAVIDEKPLLNVILTKDLEASGKFHAAELVRKLATEIQGGGGGQAFFASAGGKNAAGIASAVKKAEELM